jgi:hypothetical protein
LSSRHSTALSAVIERVASSVAWLTTAICQPWHREALICSQFSRHLAGQATNERHAAAYRDRLLQGPNRSLKERASIGAVFSIRGMSISEGGMGVAQQGLSLRVIAHCRIALSGQF